VIGESESDRTTSCGERPTPAQWIILSVAVVVALRVAASVGLPTLPDMEPGYAELALRLWNTDQRVDLYLSPIYGLALLSLRTACRGDWLAATHILFVLFSTLYAVALYRLMAKTIGTRAALYGLVLIGPLPLLTVAVAGYSHSVVVGVGLLALCVCQLWTVVSVPTMAGGLLIGAYACLAGAVRPELHSQAMALLTLSLCRAVCPGKRRPKGVLRAVAAAIIVYLAGSGAAYEWRKARSSSGDVGLFGDARYSYETYMHTLSLRRVGVIDGHLAVSLGAAAYGTAEANGHSILPFKLRVVSMGGTRRISWF
jgi:hypothetical protein